MSAKHMPTDDPATPHDLPRKASSTSCAFAVRLWKEELAGGPEYRGSVRDVMTDGFRGFRDWSGLIAFMVARVEQNESVGGERTPVDASKQEVEDRPSPRTDKEER